MRNSMQRNIVYDIVMASCDHPTAETIYLRAREVMPKISLGTVYRNLNELVETKKILRITVSGEKDHFDKTLYTHVHLFCNNCLKMIDLNDIDVTDWFSRLEKNNKVKILSNDLCFNGICQECQNN